MPSRFSFLFSRRWLCLWMMWALFLSVGMGGTIIIGPNPPPVLTKEYTVPMPLDRAVLHLNIPQSGVVEMDATETALFEVTASGVAADDETRRMYSWASDHRVVYQQASEGSVYLSWKWNGYEIPNFAEWIKDGNPGKGGTYTVSLIQTGMFRHWWYDRTGIQYSGSQVETQVLYERSFGLVIRNHTPLATGLNPRFLSVPDLGEMTLVPDEGLPLSVEANAGGGFRFSWFRDGGLWSNQKDVRVYPRDLRRASQSFHCVVSGPTGSAWTRHYSLRLKEQPRVDFSASVPVVLEGGKIRLEPKAVALSPMTFSWVGPALTAGDGRAQVLEDGTLEISAARAEDAGDYVLKVDNGEIPVTHRLQVSVLRLPSGVYPLSAGQKVRVEGRGSNSTSNVRMVPLTVTLGLKSFQDVNINSQVDILRAQAYLVGQYRCVVEARAVLPQDYYDGKKWSLREVPAPVVKAESTFELTLPTERPVMPAHALPPGHVGQDYYQADPPALTGAAASAATHYVVTGLPPGLKALPSGVVHGSATKAGDYQVKFTAVNGQGRAAAVLVPLHIAPLPEGVVGSWVAFYGNSWAAHVLQFKITSSGAFTGRWHGGKSFKGRVSVDASGMTGLRIEHEGMRQLWISPGTHFVEFSSIPPSSNEVLRSVNGRGWRNVWDRSAPASAYVGSYTVDAATFGLEVPAKDRTGQAWVKRLGQTRMVTRWSEAGRTTSSYFLGPQRQILHRWQDEKMKPSTRSMLLHLELDGSGESATLGRP